MSSGSDASLDASDARPDCAFCQHTLIAPYIMHKTSSFLVVADHAPLLEGHLLIVPKRHYACYGAVPADLDAELAALKSSIQQFFARFYAPAVFWEHGVFRQTVFHAHLHCFPLGDVVYPPLEDRHQRVIATQDHLRSWYTAHGHYFYLEDAQRALLFAPDLTDYQHVIQTVLGPGVAARSQHTHWRTPQQRQVDGKPLIARLKSNWELFQAQQAAHSV